ncbi:MAG: single-stranded DNA-binding protein [Bacteroidia bacterium]|jgi:single-strand DNA-binding protein|nr:single-stranded DNA-binding protein [Bacteroidia bacterium]|tara:strand:- start:17964 stop:18413 length:450 start_codon:yes stop_codon:yes gene_type:complete
MINKVTLIGHLGKDPEVRYLEKDRVVANLTLATNERYNDRNGNRVETTEWHNLEMWDGLAKVAEKYLKKGSLVYVEGKLKTEEWEKDGIKRYTTRIRVTTMNMMDKASGSSNETASAPTSSQESSQSIAKQNDDAVDSIIDSGDDDLPF